MSKQRSSSIHESFTLVETDLPEPVAGVDEVGRGCLAGPVVAAAVILPKDHGIQGLNDSKKLFPEERERLTIEIQARAVAWATGLVRNREIDRINILQASLLAMCKAVARLRSAPRLVIVDGNKTIPFAVYPLPFPEPLQKAVVKADGTIAAVSAASIIAKTRRDRIMTLFEKRWPGYDFSNNKGYGTKKHLAAIREIGPCPLHRRSFKGVVLENGDDHLCLPGI